MSRTRHRARSASALAVLLGAAALLVAGCAGSPSPTADPTNTATEFDPSPSPEPTGSETAQSPSEDLTISVPTLPVGGSPEVDGVDQCGHANWLGAPIPTGIEVAITQVALDPEGVFAVEGDQCGSDDDSCADSWTWTVDNQDDDCTLSVTQVVDSDATVVLVLTGTVSCASQPVCEEFESSEGLFDGSQVEFTAELGLVSPSDSTSDSTSESTGG